MTIRSARPAAAMASRYGAGDWVQRRSWGLVIWCGVAVRTILSMPAKLSPCGSDTTTRTRVAQDNGSNDPARQRRIGGLDFFPGSDTNLVQGGQPWYRSR